MRFVRVSSLLACAGVLGCAGAAPGCPEGTFVSPAITCEIACSAEADLAPCGAPDCAELGFRVITSQSLIEGGAIWSDANDSLALTWKSAQAQCSSTGREMVLTGGGVPPRTVPFSIEGSRLVTGSGTVWERATVGLEALIHARLDAESAAR